MEKVIKEQLPKLEPTNSQLSPILTWVIIGIGCIVAVVGATYLGLGAGKRLAPIISDTSLPIPTQKPGPSEAMVPAPTNVSIITDTPTPSPDSTDTDEGVYVLGFSNSTAVTSDDLTNLTPWELKVARNEIYARHGRKFVHQDLSCYFTKQSWYQVDPTYTDSKLSKLETNNATFILNYEKEISSPLINNDSGCDQDSP